MGLAQQQQGLGTAPGPQSLVAPTVGQHGLGGAGQPRQPGGQTGLGGQQFPNQLSGPHAGHMQQTKAPAQPAPFTPFHVSWVSCRYFK